MKALGFLFIFMLWVSGVGAGIHLATHNRPDLIWDLVYSGLWAIGLIGWRSARHGKEVA